MSEYIPIPVSEAQRISDLYQKSMVVILAYDPAHQMSHATTFGVTADDKVYAAQMADRTVDMMGELGRTKTVHEDFRQDFDAGLYKEAVDLLQLLYRRQAVVSPQAQLVERFLKSIGKGVRQA